MMTKSAKGKSARSGQTRSVDKCLNAAEALFLRLGYEGTSMRGIAGRAKSSLGTIVYHWGTKEALFRNVCARRFEPITFEQIRRLNECGARADSNVEDVVRALVEPTMFTFKDPATAKTTRLLYGRVLTDPSTVVLRATVEMFAEPTQMYRSLLRERLTALTDDAFHWRHTCAIGAFVFAFSFEERIAFATHADSTHADFLQITDHIVTSMIATLQAPA